MESYTFGGDPYPVCYNEISNPQPGEVAEWSNAAVSKTVVPFGYREFESPHLRQFPWRRATQRRPSRANLGFHAGRRPCEGNAYDESR